MGDFKTFLREARLSYPCAVALLVLMLALVAFGARIAQADEPRVHISHPPPVSAKVEVVLTCDFEAMAKVAAALASAEQALAHKNYQHNGRLRSQLRSAIHTVDRICQVHGADRRSPRSSY